MPDSDSSVSSGNAGKPTVSKKTSKTSNQVSNEDLMAVLVSMKSNAAETNKKVDDYSKKNDAKVAKLEKQASSSSTKLNNLTKNMKDLQRSTQMMFESHEKFKQQQLLNNITISGIAPFADEDLFLIVLAIGEKLEVTITAEDIYSIYRIFGSKSNLIVVRFVDYGLKSALLSKRRQTDVYASDVFTDINPNADNNNMIYINHHLTPHFGKLLQHGKEEVKKKTIHSCWIGSSGLLIRPSENDNPRTFMTIEAIQSYINAGQQSSACDSDKRPSLRVNLRQPPNNSSAQGASSSQQVQRSAKINTRNNGKPQSKDIITTNVDKRKKGDISLDSSTESSNNKAKKNKS